MSVLVSSNYLLAFILEIVLLVALGMWGHSLADGPWLNWLVAGIAVAVAIALWAVFAAPKSATRLDMPALLIFKMAMFGAGTLALWAAGRPGWAVWFGGLSAVHLAVATLTDRV